MKNIKEILILSFAYVLSLQQVHAQYTEDFRAKSILERSYTDIKGSPYLSDEWLLGAVKVGAGSTYKDVPLKYDQITGDLMFRDKSGQTFGFADPVSEFMIMDKENKARIYRSGFNTGDAGSEKYFFEVLYDGSTLLLKDVRKNVVEHRSYNSSTVVKSILETPAYYLVINGKMIKVRKDKKAVLSALQGNAAQLDRYIQENKLNLKEDADLAELIKYYDSVKS